MAPRLLFCVWIACSLSGCFVVDELDSARALLPDKPADKVAEEAAPKKEPAKADPDYWKNSRTFAPGGGDNGVVSCNVRGQVQFMKRDDCKRRGGQPR